MQIPISALIALALSRKVKGVKFVLNVLHHSMYDLIGSHGYDLSPAIQPSLRSGNPIIRLFKPDFSENILLLRGPAFIAMTCAYIFFTGTTTLMILGNIMAVPEDVREAAMLTGQAD